MSADPFRFRVAAPIEFNENQLVTFKSILDTFVAPLSKEQEDALVLKLQKTHTEEEVRNYCQMTNSSLETLETIVGFINRAVLPEKRQQLLLMLSLLSTRAGTFALTGYFDEFKNLPLADKEKVFINWKNSFLPQLRLVYNTFHSLACHPAYAGHSDKLGIAMHYSNIVDTRYDNIPERLNMIQPEEITDDMYFDVVVVGSGAGGGNKLK